MTIFTKSKQNLVCCHLSFKIPNRGLACCFDLGSIPQLVGRSDFTKKREQFRFVRCFGNLNNIQSNLISILIKKIYSVAEEATEISLHSWSKFLFSTHFHLWHVRNISFKNNVCTYFGGFETIK